MDKVAELLDFMMSYVPIDVDDTYFSVSKSSHVRWNLTCVKGTPEVPLNFSCNAYASLVRVVFFKILEVSYAICLLPAACRLLENMTLLSALTVITELNECGIELISFNVQQCLL